MRIGKMMQAILIGWGLFSIWAVMLLPANWVYNRLAIRAAFGRDGGPPARAQVTVKEVRKPHTVTFSNGVVADVGYVPGAVSSAFHVIGSLTGMGVYVWVLRRPIRQLKTEFAIR